MKDAVFANGCFWCTEAVFKMLKGVTSVVPGYTGGTAAYPTYERVSTGTTGHAEAIKITYDPTIISYNDLLTVFFSTHNPTTLNRQGNDVGTQYRSAIFFADETEKQEAERFIKELTDAGAYPDPIVTEVSLLTTFYDAEEYHRDYYMRHPDQAYCTIIIEPKLEKVRQRFSELLK
jgi:peptide-methionine (S)-S-oxide reductase